MTRAGGLQRVSAQAQLTDDAVKQRPDVVLHRCWRLDELAVEKRSTGTTLWKIQDYVRWKSPVENVKQYLLNPSRVMNQSLLPSALKAFRSYSYLNTDTLTTNGHFSATHQVAFIADENDGRVVFLALAPQLNAQIRGAKETWSVRYWIDYNESVSRLQTPLLRAPALILINTSMYEHLETIYKEGYPNKSTVR